MAKRTITIDGIKVTPKWNWSAQYRADTVANLTAYRTDKSPRSRADQNKRYIRKIEEYVIWLAERDGFTMPELVTISLYAGPRGSSEAPSYAIISHPDERSYGRVEKSGAVIATIDIPTPGRIYDAATPGYGIVADDDELALLAAE